MPGQVRPFLLPEGERRLFLLLLHISYSLPEGFSKESPRINFDLHIYLHLGMLYLPADNAKSGLYICTGDGVISVIEIQGENARRMTIKEFLIGNKIEEGKILK